MNKEFETDIESQNHFDNALEELAAGDGSTPSPTVILGLSGLSNDDMALLQPIWDKLDTTYRQVLMQILVDVSADDYMLSYDTIAHANLDDAEPKIRQAAIELLGEDYSLSLMDKLIKIAQTDANVLVRAEAAKALGQYVLLGEYEDLPPAETKRAEEALQQLWDKADENLEVRRRALESVSSCSRDGINDMITVAYKNSEDLMRISAICAMGNTYDAKRWGKTVISELENSDVDMLREAIRSAGALQLEDSIQHLVAILDKDEREMQEIAIWALGEIGGDEVTKILQNAAKIAEDNEDDDLLELIDDALANADLMGMIDIGDWEEYL